MRYISTRGEAPVLGFEDAALAGLARDGGLYVPETWPTLSRDEIAGLAGRPYHEIAVEVMAPFIGDAIPRRKLLAMSADAYASFGHSAVVPLVQIAPGRFVLELFHGPTLAFKDVAMQLLARVMDHILEKTDSRVTIVGATSGDTGGAAIEAFRTSKRADVFILFPDGRVSDVQRRMMTTPTEDNIHAVAIEGTFDDAQALVKAMFTHHNFRDRLKLAGVNSINWARILPQVAYYFAAAVALGAPHRPVSFVVPTGNFGDIFAGHVARRMGLSIERLVIASNPNDILPRTIASGTYEKRGVVATSSPSMDIVVSSNFERYLFEVQGRDAGLVRRQMAALTQSGRFEIQGGTAALSRDFSAASASEAEVAATIRTVREESGYLLDPHTACAVVAADKVLVENSRAPEIILATASPAKFPDTMDAIAGVRPALPLRLANLMLAPERIEYAPADLSAIEELIASRARAARGDS